jgi:hypothetical protein
MYPYDHPQDPYYNQYRGVSPARNEYDRPRPGYHPNDYGCVSPVYERWPDFPDYRGRGSRNLHYPCGAEGYCGGGAPGEWEHWLRGR